MRFLDEMRAVNRELKALDLRVKEIIGSDVDIYRLWDLSQYIPTIQSDLEAYVGRLHGVTEALRAIAGSEAVAHVLAKLHAPHRKSDAELLETHQLVETRDGGTMGIESTLMVDHAALPGDPRVIALVLHELSRTADGDG